ncbi:hypothetical protein [Methylomonas methanica]|uniref:hypothetical protein n=1 Tax=Methylomonas methanica TaxID=421 RepID=UPI0018D3D265|nr:hypothetical protein [Methylomonas methanica]
MRARHFALRANQFASPARFLDLIARLGRLARKVKSFATIAKRVARKAKKIATIAKDRVRGLKCFEQSVIRHVG